MTSFIVTAAKLIAPHLTPGDTDAGYQWCVDQLVKAGLAKLSSEVLMAKATHFMATGSIVRAVEVLKEFEKQNGFTRAKAATNLSFLYLLEGCTADADAYADLARQADDYNVRALVNKGNCLFAAGDHSEAQQYYDSALRNEPDCIEALYNIGLAAKAAGMLDVALEQYLTINGILPNQVRCAELARFVMQQACDPF
jgi:intraflagellar transport protein 88